MATGPVVWILATPSFPVRVDIVREVLAGVAEVRCLEVPRRTETPQEDDWLAGELAEAASLFPRPGKVSARLIEALPRLRHIGLHGAGFSELDLEAAFRRGIQVTFAPGANANAVAELTIGLLIDLRRRVTWAASMVRSGAEYDRARFNGAELAGTTLGVVGIGQVGTLVARKAVGLEMGVLACDPYLTSEEIRRRGASPASLDELLAVSDAVSLHVPLTAETRGLIGLRELRQMKRSSVLLNSARGRVVDHVALLVALQEQRIAGAALDVFENEPTGDHPLLRLDNVLVTPHMGGSTQESQVRIARTVAEDIRRVLTGQPPHYPVPLADEVYSGKRLL